MDTRLDERAISAACKSNIATADATFRGVYIIKKRWSKCAMESYGGKVFAGT